MKKRLGLYATYDKDGRLADYIIYCLREYKKVVDELIVVSNHTLSDDARQKLDFVDIIFERPNTGYDVGAFADVLTKLYGWEEVRKFDEIIFMNDSIFGPLYPIEPMLQEMTEREEIDFWGLAQRAVSDFDGGEKIYPAHIQSYFYVVKSRMLYSREFVEYWETIMYRVTDFRSAIINYEFAFTEYFEKRGFRWDVAVRLPGYDTDEPQKNLSPYHYNCFDMVKSGRYPFIKRKLFTGDFVSSQYSDKSDLRRTFDYIREQTDYDENLIWDYILKNYELGSMIKSLCLHEIVTGTNKAAEEPVRGEKYEVIDLNHSNRKLEDIAGEYVLLTSLRRKRDDTEPLWNAKCRTVAWNMMHDEEYMEGVVNLFEKNSRLGVLIPPMNTYGAVTAAIESAWRDKNRAEVIYQKLGLDVPFSKEMAPVHEICAVWCRKKLLTDMEQQGMLENADETVLQMIPLVAQSRGYYTEIIENAEYIKYHLAGTQELMRDLWRFLEIEGTDNRTIEACETEVMRRKIENALPQNNELYIYGAGEKACRVIAAVRSFVKIRGIFVSDTEGNPSKLFGYPVSGIADLKEDEKDVLLVVTVGKGNRKSVLEKLKLIDMENYIFV